jgi:mycoredoxin-dependent peroxiredoxin
VLGWSRRRRRAARAADLVVFEVGHLAPSFSLRDQHGQSQTLGARRGSRHVLLVFYPFAFTGVCAGELRELNDHASSWRDLDADVLAVSCDPLPSLRAFSEQEQLELALLSDFWPHGEVSTAYGAFESELGAAGRATYVIDRQGVVRWTVRSAIADRRDVATYVTALAAL